MRIRISIILLLGSCQLLVSCGSDDGSDGSQSDDGVVTSVGAFHSVRTIKEKFEVTYHDDTVIVSEDAMRFMAPTYDDPKLLEFSIDAEPYLNLEAGKVTIFPRAVLRRVVSWQKSGDKILVKTEPAILTEAYKDADIESVVEIGWQKLQQGAVVSTGIQQNGPVTFRFFSDAYAEDTDGTGEWTTEFSRKFKHKGLTVEFKLMPESWDKLKFEITASASKAANKKSFNEEEIAANFPNQRVNAGTAHADYYHHDEFMPVESDGIAEEDSDRSMTSFTAGLSGNAKGFAKATGYISGLTQVLDIEINDSELGAFYYDLKSLQGQLKIESVSMEGLIGTFNLKIPLEISIPMLVGGLPVTLKLGAEFSFRPIVKSGSEGSAKMCFIASYDGSTGLRFENGTFKNEAVTREKTADTCPNSETVSAGKFTVGLGTTVKFPSVSLQLFRIPVVANIHVKLDGTTLYEPGILNARPACQSGTEDIALIVKATLKFLGFDIETHSKLWQTKKEWNCDKKIIKSTFDKDRGEQSTVSSR